MSLRAILWLAVSSEAQAADDKESLKSQERELRIAADKEGWIIIDVISIPGFSRSYYTFKEFADAAAKDGVTAPLRMFDHWRSKDFDVLACWDGSRFGREQSIFAEFVGRTLDTGARIYSIRDGLIGKKDRHLFSAMGGYKAAKDVSDLVERRKSTMAANPGKGRPASPTLLRTHLKVRDEHGRIVGVRLDESLRPMWTALAALILEPVYWARIELELYRRYGFGRESQPFGRNTLYQTVLHPTFWGHLAQHYKKAGFDLWRVEPGWPIPPGVDISYNVVEPVYSGDLATQIKDELKRRREIGYGRGRTSRTVWNRGLFLCQGCGYHAAHRMSRGRYAYLSCKSNSLTNRRHCDNPAHIPEREARRFVTAALRNLLTNGYAALTADETPLPSTNTLEKSLDALNEKARTLVRQRVDFAGSPVEAFYTEQLKQVSDDIAAVKQQIVTVERQIAQYRAPDPLALEELRELGVDRFWQKDEGEQNQFLHRLFGDYRIVIDRHEIRGFTLNH